MGFDRFGVPPWSCWRNISGGSKTHYEKYGRNAATDSKTEQPSFVGKAILGFSVIGGGKHLDINGENKGVTEDMFPSSSVALRLYKKMLGQSLTTDQVYQFINRVMHVLVIS